MKDNLNELISMRVFAVITLILLAISISIIAVQVYASTKFWMESSEMRKTKTPDERFVNTEQAIGSLIFGGNELVQYYEQATLINNVTHLFDFKLHSVTIYVRDERDAPIGGAYVKAFSPDWGTHPGFFDYIAGDKNVPEIERMQFVFFYLHRTYGSDIHKRFIQLWANSTIKDYLMRKGFNANEIMVTLYSYLARENLAWLFRMAGYNIPEKRIDEGMKALPTSLSVVMGSLCFDAYGVDRHLVELYFPSARFEPYSKYKVFYSYIIVGGPFVNPNSATIAEKSGIRFGRDWMDVNGTVYRSEWRYSDYAIILIKGGAIYVMGTHRYGTEAALLWLSRKPLFYSYAIIKWVDINRDGNVDLEEVSEVMRI